MCQVRWSERVREGERERERERERHTHIVAFLTATLGGRGGRGGRRRGERRALRTGRRVIRQAAVVEARGGRVASTAGRGGRALLGLQLREHVAVAVVGVDLEARVARERRRDGLEEILLEQLVEVHGGLPVLLGVSEGGSEGVCIRVIVRKNAHLERILHDGRDTARAVVLLDRLRDDARERNDGARGQRQR